MGRYHNYEDEFARADARERELQRQMGMQDGPSKPVKTNSYNTTGAFGGGYNYNSYNSYNGYNNYNPSMQQSIWDNAGQSKLISGLSGGRYRQGANPRAAKLAFILLAVIFNLVTLFLLAVMFITVKAMRSDYEKCTAEVEAVVVQNVASSRRSSNGNSLYPVFRYEYDGKVFQQQSQTGRKPAKYYEGEKVTLHINPDDPAQFYDEKEDRLVIMVISSIAGVFFVVGLIFSVLAVKKGKQIQSMLE